MLRGITFIVHKGDKQMLEAVNSVVSNAPLLKAASAVPVVSKAVESKTADYVKVETAIFSSRNVDLDISSPRPILEIRDSSTGESIQRFPTEGQIRAYLQAQQTSASTQAVSENRAEPSAVELDAQVATTPDVQKPEAVDVNVEAPQAPKPEAVKVSTSV